MTELEYQTRSANTRARNALANARAILESATRQLDDYAERFEQAESQHARADIINWTLAHLATYIPANIRLDLLASAQAELTRAAAAEAAA